MATSAAKPDNLVLRASGILALVGIGGAHFEYWYRSLRQIPVHYSIIGPLFMFTFIFAWVLALVMLVFPRALVGILAAGFAFATLGGYLLSLYLPAGIFEYKDPGISYAGGIAIACEVLGGLALLAWGGARLLHGRSAASSASLPFGATAADAASWAKPDKAKPPRAKAKPPRAKAKPDKAKPARAKAKPPRAKAKPDKAKPARAKAKGRISVEDQIEQARAGFATDPSAKYGRR